MILIELCISWPQNRINLVEISALYWFSDWLRKHQPFPIERHERQKYNTDREELSRDHEQI